MRPDPQRVGAIIAEIAGQEILPHYRKLHPGAVRAKENPQDLVTIVDEAMEAALKSALLDLTPGAGFVGEELAAADPTVLDQIGEGACWIVDPLDGTRNFVNGVDEFGVIVAYVEDGECALGWIYGVPDRMMAIGERGAGIVLNGDALKSDPMREKRPAGLRSTGWLKDEWRDRIVENLKRNTNSKSGHCSAYAYLKLIRGEIDFKLSSRIHAWDHAAGALMLEELGGEARWLDTGEPYRPQRSEDRPLLATAPGRDWRGIARLLLD